jgi:RNA-directed DNA polymerase
LRARTVSYADRFVIASRGKATEALEWTRGVVERLGLTLSEKPTLNEKKTSVRNARKERFDFRLLILTALQRAHGTGADGGF